MTEQQEKAFMVIRYPQRRGYILEAHNLQRQLTAIFDLSIEVEEHLDESFSILLNGSVIYSKPCDGTTGLDHKTIIKAIGNVKRNPEPSSPAQLTDEEADDPDHLLWKNSVCSGE